ncbi:MAG: glycosyltransferase family 2 protein [Candidatus Omnitrophica bacterium]|nr:glycosyltransferase family 2 protein [Candidatus Omnitrophota bacterium]
MKVDIIIPVYNQLSFTKECIESIRKNTKIPYHLIIVDDNSNEETKRYLNFLSHNTEITILHNGVNLGWIVSVNRGINISNAEYLCIMNNDTVVYPDWLEEMVLIAERHPQIGLVNPEWNLPKHFRGTKEDFYNKYICKNRGKYIETDWIRGFCFLTKRAVIAKLKGLDSVFTFGYYDDWDFSLRVLQEGFLCVRALGSFVWHYKNITYGQTRLNHLLIKNREIFEKRWGQFKKCFLLIDDSLKNRVNEIKESCFRILRRQTRIFIITSLKNFDLRHTNCKIIRVPQFIILFFLYGQLIRNRIGSESKHFDFVICQDSNLVKPLLKIKFFNQNKYILKTIDELESCHNGKIKILEG